MINKLIPFLLFGLFSIAMNPFHIETSNPSISKEIPFEIKVENIYKNLKTNQFSLPNFESFAKGLEGFYKLKDKGIIHKNILTLVDFSLSSTEKRLWVIDLQNNSILFQSLVAHGKNSGIEYASDFSNKSESHKSSLGLFATGETYVGKHGVSLRLDGLEKGTNNKARARAIVIHGANYVSESFIEKYGRLGRSFGCPSLPIKIAKDIIETIKDKSCLFIYYPTNNNA